MRFLFLFLLFSSSVFSESPPMTFLECKSKWGIFPDNGRLILITIAGKEKKLLQSDILEKTLIDEPIIGLSDSMYFRSDLYGKVSSSEINYVYKNLGTKKQHLPLLNINRRSLELFYGEIELSDLIEENTPVYYQCKTRTKSQYEKTYNWMKEYFENFKNTLNKNKI